MKLTLPRFIPKEITETIERYDAIVYTYPSTSGKLSAVGYIGKAGKAAFHYVYRNAEQRAKDVERFFEGRRATVEYKERCAAEKQAVAKIPHNIERGAIVVYSWGWEQTNKDFFVVLSTTDSYVTVQEIGSEIIPDSGCGPMSGYCKPILPAKPIPDAKTTRHKVYKYRDNPDAPLSCSVIFKHGNGHVWDGNPEYVSWYA